jgi:hypothetical protein
MCGWAREKRRSPPLQPFIFERRSRWRLWLHRLGRVARRAGVACWTQGMSCRVANLHGRLESSVAVPAWLYFRSWVHAVWTQHSIFLDSDLRMGSPILDA